MISSKMDEENNPERAIAFIDGSNLYHRLKERGWKTWIDVGKLAKKLVEVEIWCIYIITMRLLQAVSHLLKRETNTYHK